MPELFKAGIMEPIGLLEWRKEYESGMEDIDRQHKDIVNVLNDIYLTISEGKQVEDKIPKLLDAFDFYMTEHIDLEEKYAERYDFPKTKELKESHDFIKSTYKHLKYIYEGNEEECMPRIQYISHLHTVMREWLIYHLVTLDKELCDFLREKLKE